MLIRWFILRLCRSCAELRYVTHIVHACLATQCTTTQERTPLLRSSNLFQRDTLQPCHRVKDARVYRSTRLSMVCAILAVQAESPQILVTAVVVVPTALVMGILYAIRVLDQRYG